MRRWRLKLTNGWGAILGLLGVGLLPCPDCGAPLAVHTWPFALLIWAFRRNRQRQIKQFNLMSNVEHLSSTSDQAISPHQND